MADQFKKCLIYLNDKDEKTEFTIYMIKVFSKFNSNVDKGYEISPLSTAFVIEKEKEKDKDRNTDKSSNTKPNSSS